MRVPGDTTAYPFDFVCRRSGNCCAVPGGTVFVTPADVAAIALHLGLSEAAVRSRFVTLAGDRLQDGPGPRCVFLRESPTGASCDVYPVRPERCRTWPFWPELLHSAERLQAAMRRCPGIRPRADAAGNP